MADMTITEVSQKYQISADTLRYYERIGLLPRSPGKRTEIVIFQRECNISWKW